MRILRLTVLMALVVAASCLDSVPILIPRAVGDENSAQRNALDPHLKPLIGPTSPYTSLWRRGDPISYANSPQIRRLRRGLG